MIAALQDFPGLPHRAAWVADVAGVRYVNDSKGTNVGATLAAVAGFKGPLLLIAGGDGKDQDFTPLRAAFSGKVRHVLLIGRDAPRIEAALQGVCAIRTSAIRSKRQWSPPRASRAGRYRAAVASLRQPRHVPRLRRIAVTCLPMRCGGLRHERHRGHVPQLARAVAAFASIRCCVGIVHVDPAAGPGDGDFASMPNRRA